MELVNGGWSSYPNPGLLGFRVISLSSFVYYIQDTTHMCWFRKIERTFYTSWDLKDKSGVFQVVKVRKSNMGKKEQHEHS